MSSVIEQLASYHNQKEFLDHHWTGTFEEYLDIVKENPKVTRNAYQRIYDMIMSYGREEYVDAKKKLVHYPFFDDPHNAGMDSVYGLDIPLMRLVNVFKSAAYGYGTEKRVILLHGPVGSSKSTIARLLKKGLEAYSLSGSGFSVQVSRSLAVHENPYLYRISLLKRQSEEDSVSHELPRISAHTGQEGPKKTHNMTLFY